MQRLDISRPRRKCITSFVALFLVSCSLSAQSRTDIPPDDRISSQIIKLKNGITLNYAVQGDPKGPVIVMLHGAGDSWHSFARVFPLLPASYRVYAVTLRGHGLSDHPDSGYSRADFAGDILEFLDQLQIQHATLVGHSLGSFVAQKVAEQDAGHLDRLVLIGSGPGTHRAGSSEEEITSPFARLTDPVPYTFARDFQASTIYYPVPAWFFEMMVAEAQRVPAATWHGLGAGIRAEDSLDELKKIRVPTLLLWGEKDSIFHREDQEILFKNIPQAQLKDYPETGHALHWERPERFTSDLLAFMRSNGGAKQARP
jgi:pimeloyl-ACP methyl ester carboxylesterase